ncbi:hypothetical protein M5J07_17455 [Achromobacter mucicolens]|uniref:hypothetical protein n=1 Tax=Achromobacter mucicolens TaxID=1389922 RepID=UPI0020A2C2EB|nr:hypothetical protein [Achromobacter mucicolens]MCP2516730.1 hypothetical protein [Achromobacter mucicolens]
MTTPDDQFVIRSEEEAIAVARSWAHGRELAHRDFAQFARDWFAKTPAEHRVRLHLRSMLLSFESVCGHYSTEWARSSTLLADLTSQWNLETVKHLAVFNVAGIAGAAALITHQTYGSQITTKLALPFFAAGLLLALLTFWTNMRGYALLYKHAELQRRRAGTAGEWSDVAELLKGCEGKFKPDDWFDIAERTGWSSALFGIAGVCGLAVSLL